MQKIKAHKQAFRRALRILYWVGLMILYLCAAHKTASPGSPIACPAKIFLSS